MAAASAIIVSVSHLLMLALLLAPGLAAGQTPAPSPPPAPPPLPPGFEERLEVIAVTPLHGLGLSRLKVPANVQVFAATDPALSSSDVPSLLAARAASLHLADPQGGTFQPDVLFRGFSGSPLLGASEGVAVYLDGVRLNEAFGDTVNWDVLPAEAIASINLMPGSSPLFGLNALGGALSLRTKDGFAFPGVRADATTGSFGRHHLRGEAGGHGTALAYFLAGSVTREAGWRDFSPSTIRRLFGDLGWRGTASTMHLSLAAAANDLTGNGAVPEGLLGEDRRAVFTHPDRTDNDVALVTARAHRRLSGSHLIDAVASYRRSRIGTFNADAADGDVDEADEDGAPALADGVNNRSRTSAHVAAVSAQVTGTAPLAGRENHLIVGAGVEAARSRFAFGAEWARLTPDRGTIGLGQFDESAEVDLDARNTTASVFLSDTWSITPRLSLTGSARFNWTAVTLRDRIGTALDGDHRFRSLNPAAGVTYQLRPGANLYASLAQSSRVPTPVELTCADPDDPCRLPNAFVSDPPLDHIIARTWEAGARGAAGRSTWSVAAFASTASDDIIFVSSGTLRGEGHFENVARTLRRGLEGSVEVRAGSRLSVFGAYTLQRAMFGTDLRLASRFHPFAQDAEILVSRGDRLPAVPSHTVKLGVEALITDGLDLAVHVRGQSGAYLRGDEANTLPRVPGFGVVNVRGRQRLTARAALVGAVENLLGTRYATFGLLGDAALLGARYADDRRFVTPGAPRGGWIGLDFRF